jgi:hypothetical protein
MPPTANSASGKISVAALQFAVTGGSDDDRGLRDDRAALDGSLGHEHHRHDRQDQDRALDEQPHPVDRNGPANRGDRRGVQREDRDQRAEQAGDGERHLDGESLRPRNERLDEHAHTGGDEDDQDRP